MWFYRPHLSLYFIVMKTKDKSVMMISTKTYSAHGIDDGGGSFGLLAIVEPGLLAHQSPQLVQVDGGAVGCVPLQVVMSHTHLTKVPRMAEEDTQGGQTLNSMQD